MDQRHLLFLPVIHVYPLLYIQRNRSDLSLAPMYRRGGRSQVTTRRAGCVRAASKAEIAELGRWRTQNRGYESMVEHYNKITLEDRIYITLLCM
jgi:hypothetical protein